MKIKAILDVDNRIESYASVGDIDGSKEVEVPDSANPLDYRIVNGSPVYDPQPSKLEAPSLNDRISDVEAALAELAYGGDV